MQSTQPVRSIGPEHREYEAQQPGRYRPEAPQSTHEVESLLSQMADLEMARRQEPLYERKLSHVWDQLRLFHALMAGAPRAGLVHLTDGKPPAEFVKDLEACRENVSKALINPELIPKHPSVRVLAGESNPDFHTYNFGQSASVLAQDYAFTYREIRTEERENVFMAAYIAALPKLDDSQERASRWGLWGPKSRLYRQELTNSVQRLKEVFDERLRARIANDGDGHSGP